MTSVPWLRISDVMAIGSGPPRRRFFFGYERGMPIASLQDHENRNSDKMDSKEEARIVVVSTTFIM